MSHTYAQNVIHVVFSTKERRKMISAEFQPKMWAYSGMRSGRERGKS
jgi:hypothetical protein